MLKRKKIATLALHPYLMAWCTANYPEEGPQGVDVDREPIMKGRVLGCANNKCMNFIADTGSPVAIVPHSVAVKNKLEVLPTDK